MSNIIKSNLCALQQMGVLLPHLSLLSLLSHTCYIPGGLMCSHLGTLSKLISKRGSQGTLSLRQKKSMPSFDTAPTLYILIIKRPEGLRGKCFHAACVFVTVKPQTWMYFIKVVHNCEFKRYVVLTAFQNRKPKCVKSSSSFTLMLLNRI